METQPHEQTPEPASVRRSRLRVLLRVVTRRDGRAPVWLEALVVVWLLWLYDQINNLAPLRRIAALHNAANLLAFERSLNISPELGIDRWVAAHATFGLIFSYYYVAAHFFVTFGLLGYLWWRKPRTYRPLRTQLVIINLIGLAVFWLYPVAPPRMLANDGFRDIIVLTQAVGNFHQGGLASTADQYAAMPSLHIAWAAWSAIVVWSVTRRRAIRILAAAYPLITAFVVIATGNHFLLDVFAGAALAATATLLELGAARWIPAYRRRRYGLADLRRGSVEPESAPQSVGTVSASG